ncbi:hypothetical protein OROHE_020510 [Orobanche hederae]
MGSTVFFTSQICPSKTHRHKLPPSLYIETLPRLSQNTHIFSVTDRRIRERGEFTVVPLFGVIYRWPEESVVGPGKVTKQSAFKSVIGLRGIVSLREEGCLPHTSQQV